MLDVNMPEVIVLKNALLKSYPNLTITKKTVGYYPRDIIRVNINTENVVIDVEDIANWDDLDEDNNHRWSNELGQYFYHPWDITAFDENQKDTIEWENNKPKLWTIDFFNCSYNGVIIDLEDAIDCMEGILWDKKNNV